MTARLNCGRQLWGIGARDSLNFQVFNLLGQFTATHILTFHSIWTLIQ